MNLHEVDPGYKLGPALSQVRLYGNRSQDRICWWREVSVASGVGGYSAEYNGNTQGKDVTLWVGGCELEKYSSRLGWEGTLRSITGTPRQWKDVTL